MAWRWGKSSTLIVLVLAYTAIISIAFSNLLRIVTNFYYTSYEIQMIFIIAGLVSIPMAFFGGACADIIGRKAVLVLGIGGAGLSFIVLGISGQEAILLPCVVSIGGFSACIFPAAFAFVADTSQRGDRAVVMGRLGAVIALGSLLGQLALSQVELLFKSAAWTNSWLFIATGVILILMAMFTVLRLTEPGKRARTIEATDNTPGHTPDFQMRSLMIFLIIIVSIAVVALLVNTAEQVCYISMTLLIPTWHINNDMIDFSLWLYYPLVFTAILIVAQGLLVKPSIRRLGEASTVAMGSLMALAGAALAVGSDHPLAILSGVSLIAAGTGLSLPCIYSLFSWHTPLRYQGVSMGMLESIKNIAVTFGPIIAAVILSASMSGTFLLIMIVLACTLPLIYLASFLSRKIIAHKDLAGQ